MKVEIDLSGMPEAVQERFRQLLQALQQAWPAPLEDTAAAHEGTVAPRAAFQLPKRGRQVTALHQRMLNLLAGHPEGLPKRAIQQQLGVDKDLTGMLKAMIRAGTLQRVGPGLFTTVVREGDAHD